MDRREFLRGAARTLLVLPFGTFLVHCDDDNDDTTVTLNPTQPDTTPPDAPPQVQGANVVYTSSNTNLHAHSFTIPRAQFDTPVGVAGNTTEAQAHTHTLDISAEALRRAANGETIKLPSSNTLGHTHVFTIVRV
jgi:hypothetical protein